MSHDKKIVFISHIGDERAIASALKALIEAAFLDLMDVFVSSDATSIEPGGKWLARIEHALKHCAIEIVIASPESVKRPWVNFEAGAGWIRDIPVIPLCHSGITPATLPEPLRTLQGKTATDATELQEIVPVLAKALGCKPPTIDFTDFVEAVKKFETVSRESAALTASSPLAAVEGLAPHEFAALVTIAEEVESPGTFAPLYQVRQSMENAGYRAVALTLGLQMLERKGFVIVEEQAGYNSDPSQAAKILKEGWDWLLANTHRLALHKHKPAQSTEPAEDDIPF
ncbi:MAG: toll/interleukin-1 receptor domain-containing protein [Planctomycetes bacterium]|nr:toll/interleukin-1 receptor domain-containing protein [Planctomycetota bacterium]